MDRRKSIKCEEIRRIARKCPTNNKEADQVNVATVTVSQIALLFTGDSLKFNKLMLNSCFSKYMSNNRSHFWDFMACDGKVQIGSNELILSYNGGTVRRMRMLNGVEHIVSLKEVTYTPGIMHKFVSIARFQ